MMQQYMAAKEQHPEAVLFFRMGDFYEMFFEDAHVVAREIGLTLTSRNKSDTDPVPMAGFPHHAADGYIRQLIAKGFAVAICEQVEDPSQAKGIVRREVVRVITPGVVIDGEGLESNESNYVASIYRPSTSSEYGLAYLDASTGEFGTTSCRELDGVLDEVFRFSPREVLIAEGLHDLIYPALQARHIVVRLRSSACFAPPEQAGHLAESGGSGGVWAGDRLMLSSSDALALLGEIDSGDVAQRGACLAILGYLAETQRGVPSHIRSARSYRTDAFLVVDESTKANLELTQTLMGGHRSGSLLSVIDKTTTAMGGRLLRHWLHYPLVDKGAIDGRLCAVEELVENPRVRDELIDALDGVYDLERLCGRVSSARANPADLRGLFLTLEAVPRVKGLIAALGSERFQDLATRIHEFEALRVLLDRAIVENPPVNLSEGGFIARGYDPQLDELLDLIGDGKDWILRYEAQERERTSISSLKVRYNRVFGYYIEVTKPNLAHVPADYMRKQTLANAERFFTEDLKAREDRILGAQDRRKTLEFQLFEALRREVGKEVERLLRSARYLAEIDCLLGFARLATDRDYSRPSITEDSRLYIEEGRHPVVEAGPLDERFVPNTVELDETERRLQIITGPNMAGKSTIIRQVALTVLMAQMGSFVPARTAEIGIVDRIFSRVGASDNLARGLSTFMLEMTETAYILNHATASSLVILDEIGRGTSTFDGLSIAWAVAEHLHDVIGAKTMFATHYHELTELGRTLEGVQNLGVAVKKFEDRIIFLRKLVDGHTNRSYGIEVGKMAGLPAEVVDRAKTVLANLEKGQFDDMGIPMPGRRDAKPSATKDHNPDQLSLFGRWERDPVETGVLERLREMVVESMSPIEALNVLFELRKDLEGADE
jgi:DNA mismatch repair protein MutS